MSSAVLERRGQQRGCDWAPPEERPSARGPRLRPRFELDGRRALTLDDLIAGAWQRLEVSEFVSCPVCEGRMITHRSGASHGGECLDCGTQLS